MVLASVSTKIVCSKIQTRQKEHRNAEVSADRQFEVLLLITIFNERR